MRHSVFVPVAIVALAGVVSYLAPASGQADGEAAPIYGITIPAGYRDWKLIAVDHLCSRQDRPVARPTRQRYCDQGL